MKRKEFLHLAAISAISFFSMVAYAIPPTLALISKEYSQFDTTQIQLIVTLPSLAMLPTAVLAPLLQRKYSIKALFQVSFLLTMLSGAAPFLLKDFTLILVSRAVSGLALGFVQILLTFTITTRFPKERQGRVMGLRSIFSGTGAMVIAMLGGILADTGWRLTFLLYLLMIPAFFITAACLYKMEPLPTRPAPARTEHHRRKWIDSITVFICVSCVIHVLFLQCFTTNISLFVDAEHFGGATISGAAMLFFNLSGPVFGLILAPFYRKLKGATMFAGFLATALGLLLVGFAANVALVYLGGFFVGIGMSSYLCVGPLDVTATASKELVPVGVSVLAVTLFIGSFFSPYVVNPLATLAHGFTQQLLGADDIRLRYIVSGVIVILQAVLYERIRRRRFARYFEEAAPEVIS